jgi:hypothetical protein
VTRPGSLPGAIVAAWYAVWWWYPTATLALVFTLFLFPTGRLLSPRWRPAGWLAAGVTVTLMVLAALQPSLPIREAEGHVVSNPIGVAAVENPDQSGAGAALLGLLLLLLGVALVSLVIRFRRSRGDERQQLKWFTYAGALLLVLPLEDFVPAAAPSDAIFGLVVACLPIAAGIAILRYRLYDIDRLINRTLVYALLTGLLGGACRRSPRGQVRPDLQAEFRGLRGALGVPSAPSGAKVWNSAETATVHDVTTQPPSLRWDAGRGGGGLGRPAQPGPPAADRQADHRPRSSAGRWPPAAR